MVLSTHIDEQEMLLRLRNGDQKAFDWLYNQYSKPLLWRLRKMVKDPEEADELLQDLFVKVWEKREILVINQSFEAYLYRVAQRMAVDYFRKLERQSRLHLHVQLGSTEIVDDTQELVNAKETQLILNEAIAKLPEQRRMAFTLCKIEGKSHQEAAEIMQISPNTVHNHLVKAVSFVKNYMERSGRELSPLVVFLICSQFPN